MASSKRPADGMPRTVRRILGGVLVALAVAGLLVVFMAYLLVSRDRAETKAKQARADQETATPPPDSPTES